MPFHVRTLPVFRLLSLFLLILFFFVFDAIAQEIQFTPASDDNNLLQDLSVQIETTYLRETAALPAQNRKEMAAMYKLRHENIIAKFSKKEIYTAPVASAYLQKLAYEIFESNPLLRKENLNCFFSRSGVPNASYLGEGVIILNMGLFQKLENESQVAFVLCHEMAHYYLKHSENSILKYVTTINSSEVQKELRNIKKSQFNKRTEIDKLVKNITFDSRHHTRDHESQADSMAIELLGNTRFAVNESLATLNLLDSIDNDSLQTEVCLQNLFDAPEYRFQKKWLARETGLLGGHAIIEGDPLLADSLKTHPDCKSRISYIEPLVKKYKSSQRQMFPVDEARFVEMKSLFGYEIIEYAFTSGNYTRSLFYTMVLLQKKPADPYLVTQTGRILNAMYVAQKKHTLGKMVDLPSPGYSTNYNILLQFINNLYLEDYAAISYHYLKQFRETMQSYAPYETVYHNSLDITK